MKRRRPDPSSSLEQMFGLKESSGQEPRLLNPWLTDFLIPFGSVLIAALALLAQYAQLPKAVILFAVAYLAIVAGISLFFPGLRFISFVATNQRFCRLAKLYLPKLSESTEKLRQLLAHENTDSLLYVLREVAQSNELKGRMSFFDVEHVETMRGWLSSIHRRMEGPKRRDFPRLCSDLSELVHQYNRFCTARWRALQEVITASTLPDQRMRQLKQQWNLHREAHVTFVREWASLSKTINAIAGQRLCMDYFEPLGTLE